MKDGDEFVLRPAQKIAVESNDAEALAATVNGQAIRVEDLELTVPALRHFGGTHLALANGAWKATRAASSVK